MEVLVIVVSFVIITVVFFAVSMIWSLNQLNVDPQDFFLKNGDVSGQLSLVRNKFLDNIRLLFWRVVRNSSNTDSEKAVVLMICNASNDNFINWSTSLKSITVELITLKTEEETRITRINLFFAKEMQWQFIKLSCAYRLMHTLLNRQ